MSDEDVKAKVPLNEAEVEEIVSVDEDAEDVIASKKDVDGLTDAVKELTKFVKELVEENRKWFRAGKMGG